MKASELIQLLQDHVGEYGDQEVVTFNFNTHKYASADCVVFNGFVDEIVIEGGNPLN